MCRSFQVVEQGKSISESLKKRIEDEILGE
jgi:hypothetical protein